MHCINVIIFKEKDILKDIECCKLEKGLLMLENDESNHQKMKDYYIGDSPFLTIFTDYFGGCGEQGCQLHIKETISPEVSINEGLRNLGIIREKDNDEFDTIGLGNFRCNDDLLEHVEMVIKES